MSSEHKKLEVPEDKFNAILKRLIEHKPTPKKTLNTSREKKLTRVIGRHK
jgi:hypothetical protein